MTKLDWKRDVLESKTPVLVDFWATWCGPCLAVAPAVEAVAKQHGITLVKVDVDSPEGEEISAQLGVQSIPTLMVFRDGILREQMIGAGSRQQISKMITKATK